MRNPSPGSVSPTEALLWLAAVGGVWWAFFVSAASPLGLTLLGVTTVLVAALLTRRLLRKQVSLETLGLVLVSLATIALVCLLLPVDPRQPIRVADLSPNDLTLILAGTLLLLLAAISGLAMRLGEAPGGLLGRYAPTLIVIVLATVVVQILRRYGLAHWLLYVFWGILGLWLAALLLCLPLLYYYLRRSAVNRLARLVERQRYAEAIRFGQSLSEKERTPLVLFNLAVAYRLAQRPDEAQALFDELQSRPQLPAGMPEAIAKQRQHLPPTQSD